MTDESMRIAQVYERLNRWPQIMNNSVVSVHVLGDDTQGEVGLSYAVVVHNPFDVRQYQVLAVIPPIDVEIAITDVVSQSIDEIVQNSVTDDDFQDSLQTLQANRLAEAAQKDVEFAHKAVDAIHMNGDYEEAGRLYQEHFDLMNGGDFNRPLY